MNQVPTLILVIGKGTSGKTTLGQALSRHTGWPFIDIDEGPALCTLPHPQPIETPEEFERLRRVMRVRYAVLIAAIEANLREGISHIACATFSRQSNQRLVQTTVERTGGFLKVVYCQYADNDAEVMRRINTRVTSSTPGGIRSIGHYQQHSGEYEDICLPHTIARTDHGADPDQLAVQVARQLGIQSANS